MTGIGIVPRLVDFDLLRTKYLDWADLIFLTGNSYYLDMLDDYRARGYPIFGPSQEASRWELDRMYGQEIMKKAGLNTIPGIEFNDFAEAAKFVKENPTYMVSKPSGDCDKSLSYVAHDAASLIYMLTDRWPQNEKYMHDAKAHGFLLQEKMTGCEIAVGGWFGPGGWSKWWYSNVEYKKIANGDLGQNTGEMGTLSMYVQKDKLADVALIPLTKSLKAIDYIGAIDVAGMVDDDGDFFPFEFTCRPSWPGFHNQNATHRGDPANWMLDLILGKDTLQVQENVCCVSVVYVTPDFPKSKETNKELIGFPIYNAKDREHIHLCDVMLGQDVPVQVDKKIVRMPHYVTCGDYLLVATGTGETITSARRSVYAAIQKIKTPNNPFYRTDIGRARFVDGLPLLQKHGFATHFRY
jgi:phosphoribosylamine---glycine ligase